jgi:Sec-independent protein translocase protein TatA
MSFETEIIFFVALGLLVLDPKRLHTVIGHLVQAKARFEEVTRAFKSRLVEELDSEDPERPQPSL